MITLLEARTVGWREVKEYVQRDVSLVEVPRFEPRLSGSKTHHVMIFDVSTPGLEVT